MRTDELITPEEAQAIFRGLPVSEVAEQLGCSVEQVHQLIREKQLPAINIGVGKKREYRVHKADFAQFIRDRRV